MRFCLHTGEFDYKTSDHEASELRPGYLFADAAAEERLELNRVLTRLGNAMDETDEAAPPLAPPLLALAEIALPTLLCLCDAAKARDTPRPDLHASTLVPLDRDDVAENFRVIGTLAPRAQPAPSPATAQMLATLAACDAPTDAFYWLLIHRLLPALCEAGTIAALRESRAPIYAMAAEAAGAPPLPLEFAYALLAAAPPQGQPAAQILSMAYWLNVPTAQGVLTALRQRDNAAAQPGHMPFMPFLDRTDLNRGTTGEVVVGHDLHKRTPLWFYLMRERSLMAGRSGLGPLGGRLFGEGVMGLIAALKSRVDPFASEGTGWTPPQSVLDLTAEA